MLLSNLTQWVGSNLSEKEAIKIIADAGFDAYDISLGYEIYIGILLTKIYRKNNS